jgi:hypothetical protein
MDGSALKALWSTLLPNEPQPEDSQWLLWSALHDELPSEQQSDSSS